ncbi:MAG TPA: UDP-3-O-(3-hydroxymyristoyl)glucosamine N-acyltransferase [Pseudolabrys sp.]|jgi:UDP-3-O-[3-hydroxymyristoyl] glucosamine N-acyltransferase
MLTKNIAQAIAGRLHGDGAIEIDRLVHPAQAERSSDLALAISVDAAAALPRSKAQAAVISAEHPVPSGSLRAIITVNEARLTLAKLTALFDPGPAHERGVHPMSIVAPDAKLGEGVSIGAFAAVGPRSRIGAGTTIMSHVTVGADVTIGAHGVFHSGVRVGDRSRIGDRAIVHANAVIGCDGFSFAPDLMSAAAFTAEIKLSRVHSLGNVEIGDDVEIGACTTIDRATVESTRIGHGTKIDNHVHIGHNVGIGESCVLCGMVGISGSVTIGNRVRLGGGVGVADHLRIGDQAVVAAGSGVAGNVAAGAFVSGYPALPHERSVEHFQYLGRQKRLHEKVNEIGSRLAAVERSVKNGDRTK